MTEAMKKKKFFKKTFKKVKKNVWEWQEVERAILQ